MFSEPVIVLLITVGICVEQKLDYYRTIIVIDDSALNIYPAPNLVPH